MGRYAMLVTKGDGKKHSNHVLVLFVEKRADFCRLTFLCEIRWTPANRCCSYFLE